MCKQPGSSAAEHGNNPGSQLFTLRLWAEELDAGRFEWRGRLQHMNSGQVRYFRDATTLYAALRAMLEEL